MSGRTRRVLLEEPAAGNLHGGVCEGGDSRWCHGGPTRARSWKRRTQPRKTYSLSGLLYSERGGGYDNYPHSSVLPDLRRWCRLRDEHQQIIAQDESLQAKIADRFVPQLAKVKHRPSLAPRAFHEGLHEFVVVVV